MSKEGFVKEFSAEEIDIVKSTDLAQLAEHLGLATKRISKWTTLKEHDSVRISGTHYIRYSTGSSGGAIDFLREFGSDPNISFQDAMIYLLELHGVRHTSQFSKGRNTVSSPSSNRTWYKPGDTVRTNRDFTYHSFEQKTERKLVIPNRNVNYKRLYGYLIGSRKLSSETITYFVKKKMIYETCERRKGIDGRPDFEIHNVAFVGRDPEGKIRHISLRGTNTFDGRKPFKGDQTGSDKRYSFHNIVPSTRTLFVFEAAIDAMSFVEVMAGRSEISILSLSGTSLEALHQTLLDYPHFSKIWVCTDSDQAGELCYEKIMEEYPDMEVTRCDPTRFVETLCNPGSGSVKDWNELLQNISPEKKKVQYIPVVSESAEGMKKAGLSSGEETDEQEARSEQSGGHIRR